MVFFLKKVDKLMKSKISYFLFFFKIEFMRQYYLGILELFGLKIFLLKRCILGIYIFIGDDYIY